MNRGKNSLIVSFLAIPLTLYIVFLLFPYFSSFYFAFTKWTGFTADPKFNGVNNFIKLFLK